MPDLHLVALNIRSAYNVGALLRVADSLGVRKVWLTGYTPAGDHPLVQKTALGAERSVEWESAADPVELLQRLKKEGMRIVGLELSDRSIDLAAYKPSFPLALVLGNEVDGLTPVQIAECDDVISIAQKGIKESLNVTVAAGIAAWKLLN